MASVLLLDSTLRDGGLGLEDSFIKGFSKFVFSDDSRRQILGNLVASRVDIIEVGSIEISKDDKRKFAIYQNIEQASAVLPKKSSYSKFAVLYRGPDTPVDNIPRQDGSLCELVRVIIRYSELKKSLDFCSALSAKGYKVCVQPMLTMRYTERELDDVISASNDMDAFALYFVDSYGYMVEDDVKRFSDIYASKLNPAIKIGFHAHNNMNRALSNAATFLQHMSNRDVILDSCAIGLGQGAGNLQTELIVDYLKKNYGKDYNFGAILDVCETVEGVSCRPSCGYSVMYMLPAIHKAAYKYSVDMRLNHHLKYRQINAILEKMPYDLKQRYTPENLEIAMSL